MDAISTTHRAPQGDTDHTLTTQKGGLAHVDATSLMKAHQGIVYRLASAIASRYSLNTFFRTLVNFGMEGLEDAVMRFDRRRNVRFSTFAWHRVRGAMLDGARRMGWLPRQRGSEEEPSPTAVPAQQRPCNANLEKPWRNKRPVANMPTWRQPEEQPELADHRSPEFLLERAQCIHLVRRAVDTLKEPGHSLVRRSFLEGEKMEDVARSLGMSPSWASRMRKAALQRLARRLHELAPNAA